MWICHMQKSLKQRSFIGLYLYWEENPQGKNKQSTTLKIHCLGEGVTSPLNAGTQNCILWKSFPQSCSDANKQS